MGYSKRDYTTKEERIQATINKPVNQNKNKLSEYLSQPNVKAFNSICTSRMLEKMRNNINKGRPAIFKDREECQNEIEGYFKLCYDYDMIPTVASFCVYCGSNKDTIYDHINNKMSPFSDLLKNAVASILSYQENGVMSNEVPSVPFIFLGKQYHGFTDTQNINVSASNQPQVNTNNINAIKEQLILEDETKLIETK